MAEYIEREAFIEDIKTEITNLRMNGLKGTPRPHGELYDFIDRINEQPTVDVAPIRRGRWIAINPCKDVEGWIEYDYQCSNCKEISWEESNYCQNCGARMDLEK